LKPTHGLSYCSGERAALVAEQLALDKTRGKRCAIQWHEWSRSSTTRLMNCPRNKLFASAGFSMYQYANVRIGHHPNPVPNLPQPRACANHLAGAEIGMAQAYHLRNR